MCGWCLPDRAAAGALIHRPMRDAQVWVGGMKRSERIVGLSYYTFLNRALGLNPGLLYIDVLADGWDQSTVHKSFTQPSVVPYLCVSVFSQPLGRSRGTRGIESPKL